MIPDPGLCSRVNALLSIRYGRCPDTNARRRFCPTRDRPRPFLNPPTARFPSSAPGDPELERIRTSLRVLLPGALRQRGRDHALLRELAMKTPYQCQLGASSRSRLRANLLLGDGKRLQVFHARTANPMELRPHASNPFA